MILTDRVVTILAFILIMGLLYLYFLWKKSRPEQCPKCLSRKYTKLVNSNIEYAKAITLTQPNKNNIQYEADYLCSNCGEKFLRLKIYRKWFGI